MIFPAINLYRYLKGICHCRVWLSEGNLMKKSQSVNQDITIWKKNNGFLRIWSRFVDDLLKSILAYAGPILFLCIFLKSNISLFVMHFIWFYMVLWYVCSSTSIILTGEKTQLFLNSAWLVPCQLCGKEEHNTKHINGGYSCQNHQWWIFLCHVWCSKYQTIRKVLGGSSHWYPQS